MPVIAIIRHPCDTAASTLKLFRWLLSGYRASLVYRFWPTAPVFDSDLEILRWVSDNWVLFAKWIERQSLFTVRYEDLVQKPARQLKRICDHSGLPFSDAMLSHHQQHRRNLGGVGDPGVMAGRRRRVDTRSIGKGASLRPEQTDVVREVCASTAAELDYVI
jgi:hypothetical protein